MIPPSWNKSSTSGMISTHESTSRAHLHPHEKTSKAVFQPNMGTFKGFNKDSCYKKSVKICIFLEQYSLSSTFGMTSKANIQPHECTSKDDLQ